MKEQAEYSHDVFISYCVADKNWVDHELLTRLRQSQISFVDEDSFQPGALKINAIEQAVEKSRRVLLVVTTDYLNNAWDNFENQLAFAHMLSTDRSRVIPALKENVGRLPLRLDALVPIKLYTAEEEEWGRLTRALSVSRPAAAATGGGGEQPCTPVPTAAPQADRHDTRDTLNMFFTLIYKPEVRGPLSEFRAEFQVLRDRIETLSSNKKLHDLFQRFEDHYETSFAYGRDYPPDAEFEWSDLEGIGETMDDITKELIQLALQSSFATEDDLWVRKLRRAVAEFGDAARAQDKDKLKGARRRLSEVLNSIPARINASLVDLARSLRLTSLEKVQLRIHENLSRLGTDTVTEYQLRKIMWSVQQVDEIDRVLKATLFVHDALQQIDGELRRVEPFIVTEAEYLIEAWEDISPKLRAICEHNRFDWEDGLRTSGTALEGAFAADKRDKLKGAFQSIRRKVTRSFNRVDTAMLERCAALKKEIGEPLALLLVEL